MVLMSAVAWSQPIPIGQWRSHAPYKQAVTVTNWGGKIYCASSDGLFSYNKLDNSIERLTRVQGLSDVGISRIRYSSQANALLIGYTNGNLDMVLPDGVVNISDIKRSGILGDKKINNIMFINQYAYLACGFGIVVLDLNKREVKDTYLIGANGTELEVLAVASDGTNIYAATKTGLHQGALNNPNLANFASWSRITQLPASRFNAVAAFQGKLMVNQSNAAANTDTMYVFDGTNWSKLSGGGNSTTYMIEAQQNRFVVTNYFSVRTYDTSFNNTDNIDGTVYTDPNPRQAVMDNEGTTWIADAVKGLVRVNANKTSEAITPNGPNKNLVYNMQFANDNLWVVTGGRNSSTGPLYRVEGVYNYSDYQWYSYNSKNQVGALDTVFDLVSVAIDPSDSKHIFVGSWGRGVVELQNGVNQKFYTPDNSPLKIADLGFYWVPVGGTTFDTDGNLWVSNAYTSTPLLVKKKDNTWETYSFPGVVTSPNMGAITVDEFGQKWIILGQSGGILVFNDNNTLSNKSDDRSKLLNTEPGKGALPSKQVLVITNDKDGELWVGTDKGVAVFYSPGSVFSGSNFDAQQILIQQDGFNQYLLESEQVNTIVVDAANRKWIGTQAGGAFLMSPDGTQQLQHFTFSNSPLPSNDIQSIAIDDKTGEIYFGTSKGIVSYRGTATEAKEKCSDVYAFPNPVKNSYRGAIAIKGVVGNGNVKITDVSGNLVFETTATGGQAMWNGTNFAGERVQTGVYLVFSTDADGTNTCATKLLFIN